MTLIELSEFVKQFEETFGVTAAAPVAVARRRRRRRPPAGRGRGGAGRVRRRPRGAPARRRSRSSRRCARSRASGLKEAKDLVDGTPATVLEKVNKEAADKAKAALEGAGATVTVK